LKISRFRKSSLPKLFKKSLAGTASEGTENNDLKVEDDEDDEAQ
jgi:hypothetical protein